MSKGTVFPFIALALADRTSAEHMTALQLDLNPDETSGHPYQSLRISYMFGVEVKDTLESLRSYFDPYSIISIKCRSIRLCLYMWTRAVFVMFV